MNSLSLFICAIFFTAAWASPAKEGCDITTCKGPLKFYEELSCEPVYKNKDCCPYKYDCKDLKKNRSVDKCYVKGHEYNIGDRMREEDTELCSVDCVCRDTLGVAGFVCASVECFNKARPGCYLVLNASKCCPGPEVCPEKPEDWPTCVVDGKTYKAGDSFIPAGEPDKQCRCGPGYKGENIAPFCQTRSSGSCGTKLRHAYQIHHNCSPVFYPTQSPQTDCAHDFRCQNDRDEVIKPEGATKSAGSEKSDDDMICYFGNLTMKVGEELKQKTGYDSVCVKCVCEIPPIPTCQRLGAAVCDYKDHPNFDY